MTYRRLMTAAFLLNGSLMVVTGAVGKLNLGAYIPAVLFCVYAVGGVIGAVCVYRAGKAIQPWSVAIGAMGGIGTAAGLSTQMAATVMLPGYIVFPVTSGGTLIVVALIGRFVLKEHIGPYGIAGIVAGACAIGLLGS
mgnify:CR=1 FL=1